MLKLLKILILLFIVPVLAFSQQSDINQLDDQGRKTGLWKKFYENGNMLYEGSFCEGKPVGILKRYYDGGVLKAEMNFITDTNTSYAKLYYDTRILAAEGKYIAQKKDSTWNYYSFINKRLTIREDHIDGKKDGFSIKYYDDGSMAEKKEWKEDLMHGSWEQFFENGQIRLTCNHITGKRDGEFKSFNSEGGRSIQGLYIKGEMDGKWIYFTEEDEVDIEIEYIMGKMLPNKKLKEREKEFSKMLDESVGKYPEPDSNDFR